MRPDKMKAAKMKAGNYCAYQERTQQEVRDKLYSLGLYRDEVEDVLTELISENFVNEERFAKSFARGKFNLKKWGKRKIIFELKKRNLSPYCIDQAIKEISDEAYEKMIFQIIENKMSYLPEVGYTTKNRIIKYLIGKGFETEKAWTILNSYLKSEE